MKQTKELIDKAILNNRKAKGKRDYVGASILGTECDRQLWYKIKQPKDVVDARRIRIFELGDAIEEEVVKFLRLAGLKVFDKDENGKRFGFDDGDIKGNSDGVVIGLPEDLYTPHLLEIKSANSKRFKAFEKEGIAGDPVYKTQCHIYMQKLGLTRCLFIVYNKDTSDLYLEQFELDNTYVDIMMARGREILTLDEMPDRRYKKSTFFKCKFCDYRDECWKVEK